MYVSYKTLVATGVPGEGGQLDVIDPASESIHSHFVIGNAPDGLAVDTANDTIYVADELGNNVAVLPARSLGLNSFGASPADLKPNQTTNLSVAVSGGVPPFQFNYTGLPPGCASRDAGRISCTPTRAGVFNVLLEVQDRGGESVNGSLNLTVYSPLSAGIFNATPSTIPYLGSTNLTSNPSGGVPPYRFQYSNLPAGCVTRDVNPLPCSPAASGRFRITLIVSDSIGNSINATTTLTTLARGVFPVEFSETGLPNGTAWAVTLNGSQGYSANSSIAFSLPNGTGYAFNVSPVASYNATPRTGTLNVSGSGASKTITFAAVPSSSTLTLLVIASFVASPDPVSQDNQLTLSVTASGGDTPYSYSYQNLPAGCPGANTSKISCHPNTGGTWRVTVTVADPGGQTSEANVSITVAPTSHATVPSNPPTTPSTLPVWPILAVGVVAAAAVVGGLLWYRRSRANGRKLS
jgi:hypothetical protein